MTTFQVLSLIFLVSLIIGVVFLKVIQKKGYIEESPYQWAFLLLGLLIGTSLFLSFTLPSLIIYWVISGINYFFGSQILFNSQSDMYIFSLTVSIFAFIYMLFSVLLLKVAAIKFHIPKLISQAIEFFLIFFSVYLSIIYISNHVLTPIFSTTSGLIIISLLVTLIYSGLDQLFDGIDNVRRNRKNI